MRTDILFGNIELLADAPNGVPKLREMILQLAVQGKLVSQNPMDESTPVLLAKIETEKKRNNAMACQKWGSRLKTLYQAKIVLEKCKKEL